MDVRCKFNQDLMKGIIQRTLAASLLLCVFSPAIDAQEDAVDTYLGTWALTIDKEENNAGWLEVNQSDGYLSASLLWGDGSVFSIDQVFMMRGDLFLVMGVEPVRGGETTDDPIQGQEPLNWYQIYQAEDSDSLRGYYIEPDRESVGVNFVDFKLAPIPASGPPPDLGRISYGKPVQLFNGYNLQGWEMVRPGKTNGWSAENGILVNRPYQEPGEPHINYGNLRTFSVYKDFNLKLEVNVPTGSNSGVYLRGIYEIQLLDSYGNDPDPNSMGALYSRITPAVAAEKPAGEWQSLDITLYRRYLTVVLNGNKIIDNQPVRGITGGAMFSDESKPGPIMLQGDHGPVSFRNLVLTPILE